MPETTVEGWRCNRCQYTWPKKKNKEGNFLVPVLCANPKCHSAFWNRNRLE